ncbi:uncharacterized protein LOC112525001 [Cynara cardunculus var. scolymus]|uniref:uncharacterized protein LOC112525001 n=1 Tax=Cynara cardunculus var. scolymus TaxID=59895 RepID=UPI000D622E96|nr:uncharacterized protein LOC112525001 [Cynara cardunculus var. scolymus]
MRKRSWRLEKQRESHRRPHSSSQRFSSRSKYEYKDRFGEKKKYEEKKYENNYDEKKKSGKEVVDENKKCYNCGKRGHLAVNCRKPVSKNTDYYKNIFILSKQKDAGKTLMVEDDHWLNLIDEEEEVEAHAYICLMVKEDTDLMEDEDTKLSMKYLNPLILSRCKG